MSGRRSKTNGKTKKTENAVETTKDKNDVVTTSKVTAFVSSTAMSNSRLENAERVHYRRMRGNSAQATSPDNARDMPLTQKSPDAMGTRMDKEAERPQKEMPPVEPNPLSEEDAPKLQQKVKALEETLSAMVASNEQKVANLGLELDAEKERVLQIEKDKRAIQEECAKYKQELEELKGQTPNIQVPMVACNDKEGAASDDEYNSMEVTDATANVSAGVPPKHVTPFGTVGEERYHQHHESEFKKSVKRSNIQTSGQTTKLDNPVEELHTRLLEVEVEKNVALLEQDRLAKEVASLQQEMTAQVRRMEAVAAKERSELEGECVRLRRECEELKDTNESLDRVLDNDGSGGASTVEDRLADATQPVSQLLEHNQQSNLQHSHFKMPSIRRHASCDAVLSISDGDQSSELEEDFYIINPGSRSEDFRQGLAEIAQATGLRIAPSDHRVTKLQREVDQLKIEKADLQNKYETSVTSAGALQKRNEKLMDEASSNARKIQSLQEKCDGLKQDYAILEDKFQQALQENEARIQHEQILRNQLNDQQNLEKTCEKLKEKEMPPLEPIPLSEEDSPKLQRKVEALEETLSATVASNEQRVANLGLELDAEKERVLQIEKDKRAILEECAKYKQELEELKGQTANIQVPMVACNDKEGAASDDEYNSMEATDATANDMPLTQKSPDAMGTSMDREAGRPVRMSDWEDYAKEPTAAGASYTRSNEQIKKLKEENDQLQLQESASSQCIIMAVSGTDSGEDDESFHSFTALRTDGPPLLAARVSSSVPYHDIQSLGRIAEEQHASSHRKESDLAAEAVKTHETFPREENPPPMKKQAGPEETPTSVERESEILWEVEGRAWQLEAELYVMREEKEDLKHQMAKVRDECERAKRKVLVDAERDKNVLVKENEHFRLQSESLESLLQERNGTIQQLREELQVVKGLHEASCDSPYSPKSLNSSSCTLEENESDQLKAAMKAREESKELEKKAKQELEEKKEDMNHVNEKLRSTSLEIRNLQATAEGLTSQITTLQMMLAGAEANVGRTQLSSQFREGLLLTRAPNAD